MKWEFKKATVCRKEHFNAAHRLNNSNWSEEKNRQEFGLCNNPNFHGHNYQLVVKVSGEIDPFTGFVMDMKLLKKIIQKQVIDCFDHKNLNLDTVEFSELNPTAENIAAVIWHKLRDEIHPEHKLKILLYETERNFVEYPCE